MAPPAAVALVCDGYSGPGLREQKIPVLWMVQAGWEELIHSGG